MTATATEHAPTVTVLLPISGPAPHLAEAVDSILNQTFRAFELLIIDDGADEEAEKLIRRFDDPRIRVVRPDPSKGDGATLAAGVGHARGAYVAFMVPDGVAHPERLARQIAFLDSHPDHAAVSAWVDWIDEGGHRRRIKRKPVAADEVAARRLFRSGIEHVASLARTAVLREHAGTGSVEGSANFDLWARIAAQHKLSNLPEILLTRRRTGAATEDPEQRRVERGAVYGLQLAELGIAFTDDDLDRHFLLRRMRKERFAPDHPYLAWAEAWLRNLQAANERTHAYPEPVFSEVLGTYWVKVCWHGSRRIGRWAAWRAFRSSPLRRWAWPGLKRQIFRRWTGSF
jgi:glycosyltransferase involved in cell wall biosynthesis